MLSTWQGTSFVLQGPKSWADKEKLFRDWSLGLSFPLSLTALVMAARGIVTWRSLVLQFSCRPGY